MNKYKEASFSSTSTADDGMSPENSTAVSSCSGRNAGGRARLQDDLCDAAAAGPEIEGPESEAGVPALCGRSLSAPAAVALKEQGSTVDREQSWREEENEGEEAKGTDGSAVQHEESGVVGRRRESMTAKHAEFNTRFAPSGLFLPDFGDTDLSDIDGDEPEVEEEDSFQAIVMNFFKTVPSHLCSARSKAQYR